MPRDLFGRNAKDEALLTASPESQSHAEDLLATSQGDYAGFSIHHEDDNAQVGTSRPPKGNGSLNLSDLHPYVQTLSLSDVESCVALETATFPEHERCSREKFIYRLTTCPELSLGLFSTAGPDDLAANMPTYAYARPPDSASPTRRSTIIAQVIATKCPTSTVTDEAMGYPENWQVSPSASGTCGHQERGRTIAVHSLAALPEFKGRGLGKIVMKSYMERMAASGIADRIALLAHDHLVDYYEMLGFRCVGKSQASFGGGGWNDMVYEILEKQAGS